MHFFPRIRRVREKTHLLEPLWREAKRKQISFRIFLDAGKEINVKDISNIYIFLAKKSVLYVRMLNFLYSFCE